MYGLPVTYRLTVSSGTRTSSSSITLTPKLALPTLPVASIYHFCGINACPATVDALGDALALLVNFDAKTLALGNVAVTWNSSDVVIPASATSSFAFGGALFLPPGSLAGVTKATITVTATLTTSAGASTKVRPYFQMNTLIDILYIILIGILIDILIDILYDILPSFILH
jgi:hypothetical protein